MGFLRRGQAPEQTFRDEAIRQLERQPGVVRVRRTGNLGLEIERAGDGPPGQIGLFNVWSDCEELSFADQRSMITQFLAAVATPVDVPETWAGARLLLRPVVLPVSSPVVHDPAMDVPSRPLLPFLAEVLAIDTELSLVFVTNDYLTQWGVSLAAALTEAHDNLGAAGLRVTTDDDVTDLYVVIGPDGYISSWLAAPTALWALAESVHLGAASAAASRGTVLVLAPDRDVAFLLDDRHLPTLHATLNLALETFREDRRRVSPVPYEVGPDGLMPWAPAPEHPLAEVVRQCKIELAGVEYHLQKQRLDELFPASGVDVFVASYLLENDADGIERSFCVWVQGVEAGLLPVTELVVLQDFAGEAFSVRWSDLHRLTNGMLRPEPGLDPPRWRISAWPSPTVLAALRMVAVPMENTL